MKMKTTRTIMITVVVVVLVGSLSGAARADWDPVWSSDRNEIINHKMHYPQLPDPTGWDVYADAWGPMLVADDWKCSQSGPVDDIHIWGSWSGDFIDTITNVHVSIHKDIPDPDGDGPLYSMPGELEWERDFSPNDILVRDGGTGEQGFYIPDEAYFLQDHSLYHQINIDNIRDPFIQEEGKIYWLDIQVTHSDPGAWWGWKTSQNHFNDDAVWWDYNFDDPTTPGVVGGWRELRDPLNQEISLDMAFVITPEPATLGVLILGLIPVLLRRK